MQPIALILGGNGRLGRHMTQAFQQAGWATRQFRRGTDNLWDTAWGAQVIVNCWNPPYPDWAAQLPPMIDQLIEVSSASGATLIQPGNVYVYGDGSPDILTEDTPHRARNPLGKVRIAIEDRLRKSGIRCILLRAGDFLDDQPSGNWFDKAMVTSLDKGRLTYPGNPGIPHAWAWLPDLARAAVTLAERRGDLAAFEEVVFPGYALTGQDLARILGQVTGREVTLRPLSWLPLQLSRPFWPLGRHLLEMRYLWDMPHRLDGAKFGRLVPGFDHTPPAQALRLAVQHKINPDQMVA
ncbi:epimerase [Actibacterium sp. XHP0104]|uniref:epimerase n=1 Tax=Actibacterium sp. XHP0104 TaxID=2984335 RepID=UPI0021E92FF6|nr:epimerase [Actibacterium sp. XHP0104]MCV2881710.1 epimerase [Actibacterium sp. XHP0104]